MNIKTLALSLSIAFAAGSGSAMAAIYDLGDIAVPAVGIKGVSQGAFMDLLEFSLSTESTVGILIKDLPNFSADTFTAVLDIFNLSASLYTSTNILVGGLSYSTSGMIGPLTVDQLSFNGTLDAGAYTLKLAGTSWGQSGGAYSYALAAAPVPEPETWAMMIAGLGLVGFALRRRNAAETKLSV